MRYLLRIVAFLLAVALSAVLVVFGLLGTAPGLRLTASMIGSIASSADQRIEISQLDGVLSGTPSVAQITIADSEGVWLTVDEVTAEVSLGRLLEGSVDVGRLSVGTLDVARRPQAASQTEQSGPPSLPSIPIKVDNIFLRSIQLAEPVLGEKAVLQLTGSVLLRNQPVDLSGVLDVVRIDGTKGEVSAQWTVAPDSNELALKLTASEPADGLVARALDIYGLPAVDISVAGSGPLDAWQAKLAVSLDGKKTVEGDVSLSVTDQHQSVDGALKGYLAPLMPQRVRPLFAGDTHIELSAERDGHETVRLKKLSARSALLSVEASGSVLPDANSVDFNTDITFGTEGSEVAFELSEQASVNIGHTRISSTLKGTLEKADWTLAGSVQSLSNGAISAAGVKLSGQSSDVDFLNGSGKGAIELTAQSLATGEAELDRLLTGAVRMTVDAVLKGSEIELTQVDLATDALKASANGQLNVAEQAFDIRTETQVQPQDQGIVAEVFGGKAARISGRVTQESADTLVFTDLEVDSDNLRATGSGQLSGGSVELHSQMSIVSLADFRKELEGGLQIDVGLTGSLDAPNFELQADGVDLSVLEKPLEAFSVTAKGVASPTDPKADVEIKGRYEDKPVAISASVSGGPNGAPVVDTLDLTVPGARAQGKLTADAKGLLNGKLDVDVSSLAQLGPLLLQDGLSGSLSGSVVFADKDGKQSVTADFTVPEIGAGPVEAKDLSLTVAVDDLSDAQAFTANASAQTVNVSGTSIEELKAQVSGTPQQLPFSVSGRVFDAPMSVVGEVSSQHGTTTIELSKASATYKSIPIQLTEPVSLTLAESATHIETATLKVGKGTVVVKGTATDELAFDVAISAFPVSLVENVAATGLGQSGTLSGKATISGTPSDPNVSYDLRIADFSVDATRGIKMPALAVHSSGSFASGTLKTQTKATGSGIDFGVTGTVDIGNETRLDLKVDGKAPLELASLAMADTGVQFEGGAQLSMTVTGSAGKPVINGKVTTSGADFIDTNTALTIREINGSISFDGTSARVDQLNGRLGSNGTVSVSGTVGTDPAKGLPADLSLKVENGTYTNNEFVTAQFNADLKIEGPMLSSGKVGGTISLERTDISIPDSLPASIPFVDVKHRHASKSVMEQARELEPRTSQTNSDTSSSAGLLLDIEVKSPARIFLRGRGIDAEFGGSIQITGTSVNPRVKGSFSMIRGRIDILTKRFEFNRGTITFAGPLDPALSFQTTTTQSGASYSINVGGTASAPEISFSSSPTMPEDEILANLFFGKSLSKLSAVQIAQLANALASIGGADSGGGILGRLRSFAGLADIDINTDDADGGTSLGIGRYLNDRTYLNVEQGLSGGRGRVTIDMDLTDNLKARGEADTDGNTKAGVFFERDY